MNTSRNHANNQNIVIKNMTFETVDKFKYLGVMLTNDNRMQDEIMLELNQGTHVIIQCRSSCHLS